MGGIWTSWGWFGGWALGSFGEKTRLAEDGQAVAPGGGGLLLGRGKRKRKKDPLRLRSADTSPGSPGEAGRNGRLMG